MTDFNIPTPTELKNARKAKNLTQGELADKADMSQAMLSQIERGKRDTRVQNLRKIVRAIEQA